MISRRLQPMLVRFQPSMQRRSVMMAAPFQILEACHKNGHQLRNMLRYFQGRSWRSS